jgi:hypothetical protein
MSDIGGSTGPGSTGPGSTGPGSTGPGHTHDITGSGPPPHTGGDNETGGAPHSRIYKFVQFILGCLIFGGFIYLFTHL